MNLLSIFSRFPDQESCIEYLEKIRWGDEPHCPHCGSIDVARKGDAGRVGRWNCHACKSSFNVLAQTIFEKTRIPLQKWFFAIGLIVNAKKSLSSCQLARDLDMNQKSAWYMQQRIRAAMLTKESDLLQGIVEADEAYVGGKPRKGNRRDDDKPNKRGRGTKKTPVIGVVERGGRAVARVADDLSGKGLYRFLKNSVDPNGSLLITVELSSYNSTVGLFQRAVINHKVAYADGATHTSMIESFCALIKRACLFLAESCWKFNQRKNADPFAVFVKGCFA